MREILFRGKRLDNGEWVFGELVTTLLGMVFIIVPGEYGTIEPIDYRVDPSTVGPYTGMTDKNGVKIFEGDIVRTKKYGKIIGHTNVNDFDIFEVIYEPCTFRLVNKNRGFNLVDDGFSKFEVIGNIHDSPELLEGVV